MKGGLIDYCRNYYCLKILNDCSLTKGPWRVMNEGKMEAVLSCHEQGAAAQCNQFPFDGRQYP